MVKVRIMYGNDLRDWVNKHRRKLAEINLYTSNPVETLTRIVARGVEDFIRYCTAINNNLQYSVHIDQNGTNIRNVEDLSTKINNYNSFIFYITSKGKATVVPYNPIIGRPGGVIYPIKWAEPTLVGKWRDFPYMLYLHAASRTARMFGLDPCRNENCLLYIEQQWPGNKKIEMYEKLINRGNILCDNCRRTLEKIINNYLIRL